MNRHGRNVSHESNNISAINFDANALFKKSGFIDRYKVHYKIDSLTFTQQIFSGISTVFRLLQLKIHRKPWITILFERKTNKLIESERFFLYLEGRITCHSDTHQR